MRHDAPTKQLSGEPGQPQGDLLRHPQNQPYDWPVLKLHGSINWFRYVPVRVSPFDDDFAPTGSILQIRPNPFLPDHRNGWMTERELITPVLYKQGWLTSERFDVLWQTALDALRKCRRLAVIGYSFPPTDFATKRLFLEAFDGREPLEALIVVDPDPRLLPLVRRLTHHSGPVTALSSLEDYVQAYT